MKFDFENIDDVFKEGLEGFTEQPSGGVWDKISGKMFWHDMLHLRFGNYPKIWIGGSAFLVLVLSTLWLVNIPGEAEPASDNLITANNESVKGTENSANQNATSDGNIQNVVSTEIVEQPQNVADNENIFDIQQNSNRLTFENESNQIISEANLADESANLGNDFSTENEEASISSVTGSQVSPVDANNGIDENDDFDDLQSAVKSNAEVKTSNNNVELAEESRTFGLKETSTIAAVGATPATEQVTAINEDKPDGKENMLSENITSKDEGREFSSGSLPLNSVDNSVENLPELSPRAFAIAGPGSYKQRPPQRNYHYPAGLLHGGYQPYFSVSAYFSPEVTEYQRVASESKENSYLGGIALSYHTSRYIVQLGLEYSRFDDLGDYLVNINSYDSIGYYDGISGFDIDPENPGALIYHTHTVEVWDTVQHHSHEQTRNHYSYLQIPVMFGYKAFERGIFSAHIKVGPSISFLLNREEPTLNFRADAGARVAGVDDFTASRLNTNVQVLMSLALRFQFNNRAGLIVEPTYRQYLNSVYDVNDNSLKNPYGIGVKGGIFINF